MTKKIPRTGVCRTIQRSIRSVLYWLPLAHRYCCLTNFRNPVGASV